MCGGGAVFIVGTSGADWLKRKRLVSSPPEDRGWTCKAGECRWGRLMHVQ